MDLSKLLMRQQIGVVLLSTLLLWCLVPLAFGKTLNVDETLWFFIFLFASLLVPERLTAHLLALWGLFFAVLSLSIALGVPLIGIHEWGRESGAIGFGVAALALLSTAFAAARARRRH